MNDVLLSHAFFLDNDTKQREEKYRPYPPLATLYAASVLRESGFSVGLFDATLKKEEGSFCRYLGHYKPRLLAIYEDSFNFLSKMCLNHVREATFRMLKQAHEMGIPTIVSSSDASDNPESYLASGADFVILGEGENTLRELATHILRNNQAKKEIIPGIVYIDPKNSAMVRTAPRPTERKLDLLPFPARDLLDIEAYRTAWYNYHDKFSMNMVTTRGCPYHCTWCAKPIWGKTYAVRSASSVAEELDQIKRNYAPDHIWFSDDIFGLKPGWVEKFSQEVTKRNAVIPFMIQSRADLINTEVVSSLASAGCEEVWLGAESGSQKVLDAMKKGITLDQIYLARDLLRKYGIRACFFIQFGYPCETLEDIKSTIELVRTALPDDIGVSVSYPLPGTEFYDMVRHELHNKRHWDESNDLDVMFKGNFKSAYYRRLGNFLHRDLDTRLKVNSNRASEELADVEEEWNNIIEEADLYKNINPVSLAN